MNVSGGRFGTSPLEVCPQMAARCPHKQPRCDDPQSSQCHYVTATTATVRAAVASLQAFRTTISAQESNYLRKLEEFLAKADMSSGIIYE